MDDWIAILLPFVLLLVRVAAFFAVLPILGWSAVPAMVRVGTALLLAVFFACVLPRPIDPAGIPWMRAVVLMLQEAAVGLALGLAARLVYSAVEQGGMIAAQQMGFADAGVIDPVEGTESHPIATFLEIVFAVLFLAGGGHHLLLTMMAQSYRFFPVAKAPDVAVLAEGVVLAGSAMLLFALKLAAPILAGFLVLAVLLCILARALPEMNILLASFPLRVGMGLLMAAAVMPLLDAFTAELARWMSRFLLA